MPTLPHLFSPLKIGPISVENRIMLPGMSAGTMLDSKVFGGAFFQKSDRLLPFF